jgi:Tat protein secretion system quality control protein TatD with DNase activity
MPLSDLELPELFEFIDTHFHLDVLIRKLKTMCKELNFDEVEGMLGPFHQHHLLFGIANYAYPSLWQCWREQVNTHSRIRLTFGIHSHMTVSSRMWRDLHQLMQEPICVAVGETGFGYTSKCECIKQRRTCHSKVQYKERNQTNQEEAFLNHLQLAARLDKPVVLHCRDHGDGTAAARVLQLIHQHNFTNLKFHHHYFSVTLKELEYWRILPRVVFGITFGLRADYNILENRIPKIPDNQQIHHIYLPRRT